MVACSIIYYWMTRPRLGTGDMSVSRTAMVHAQGHDGLMWGSWGGGEGGSHDTLGLQWCKHRKQGGGLYSEGQPGGGDGHTAVCRTEGVCVAGCGGGGRQERARHREPRGQRPRGRREWPLGAGEFSKVAVCSEDRKERTEARGGRWAQTLNLPPWGPWKPPTRLGFRPFILVLPIPLPSITVPGGYLLKWTFLGVA